MNIFVLDRDPYIAASMYCDQHVTKMILESAQLLSTEAHRLGVARADSYVPTHQNHPCAVFLRDNVIAAIWLHDLIVGLADQHLKRFRTHHKSEWVGRYAACQIWEQLSYKKPERASNHYSTLDWPLAMPDEHKDPDPVVAYRQYYQHKSDLWKNDPKRAMRYTNTTSPGWLKL